MSLAPTSGRRRKGPRQWKAGRLTPAGALAALLLLTGLRLPLPARAQPRSGRSSHWIWHARLRWRPAAPARIPARIRVRLRLTPPRTFAARRLDFQLARRLTLLAAYWNGVKLAWRSPAPGSYQLSLPPQRPEHHAGFRLIYAGSLPACARAAAGLELRRRDWLPRFTPNAAFRTWLRLKVPAGLRLFTRGAEIASRSDGEQTWSDSQPGRTWRILLLPRLATLERVAPGAAITIGGVAPFAPAARARLLRLAGRLLAGYAQLSASYGRPRRLWLMRLWIVPSRATGAASSQRSSNGTALSSSRFAETALQQRPAETATAVPCRSGGDADFLILPAACLRPVSGKSVGAIQPPGSTARAKGRASAALPALLRRLAALWWQSPAWRGYGWLRRAGETQMGLQVIAREQGRAARWAELAELARRARRARHPLLQPGDAPPCAACLPPARAARAALVLNALRLEIGAINFRALLAAAPHAAAPRRAAGHTAGGRPWLPAFFRRRLRALTGKRWGWFWRQWLLGNRLPQIRFRWQRVRLPLSGPAIRLSIRQRAPPFTFRAPIRIRTASGRDYWQMVAVHNRFTVLAVPVPGRVRSVRFDPHHELLR